MDKPMFLSGNVFCLTSCCSDESDICVSQDKRGIEKNVDGTEIVYLSNGESIVLEDTVTYQLKFVEKSVIEDDNQIADFSRGIIISGYDSMNSPSSYTKYHISGLEKWGISPTVIYIGKLVEYYKELPVNNGYSIFPSNSKYTSENSMGFNPPSIYVVGYHTLAPTEWTGYETGVTQLLYINCDASGAYWNKNIPCNPEDFRWYYRQIENE